MILGLLQARFSSTRLPGKVLKPILGKPMLWLQIERIRRSTLIDRLVVVTSEDESDQEIVRSCKTLGVDVFTGSLDDVLDRFYQCAKSIQPQHIVRLTGDCPLADPRVIDSVIQFHLDGSHDYSSNSVRPTFPDGLDVEVMTFAALEQAWREASLRSQREHVTPYLYRDHETQAHFKLGFYKETPDLSHLRWTVDIPADFELIREVYEALYPKKPDFGMRDILDLLEARPELSQINSKIERNAGYKKSLEADRKST